MKRNCYYILVVILLVLITSCKATYSSHAFNESEIPQQPNYSNSKHWAVLPNHIPIQLQEFISTDEEKLVDVFFVYPTFLTDRKNDAWNASINDSILNQEILNKSIHFQASAWANAGNLYVPYYRQSHYRIYLDEFNKESGDSYKIAYNDVKTAFEYYLKHYNNGRPIIIASHSQGSGHCKQLLKDYFDGTPLQKKLVAAYIPGIKVLSEEFKALKPLGNYNETGGYVTWNSYKRNRMPKKYKKWFKGGVTSNPIIWNHIKYGDINDHKGLLYTDNKLYAKSVSVEVKDGILWVAVPKVPNRILLRFIKNYHFADINLFWEDIRINSQDRIAAYFANHKE